MIGDKRWYSEREREGGEEEASKKKEAAGSRFIYTVGQERPTLFRPSLGETASTKGKATSNRTVIRASDVFLLIINQRSVIPRYNNFGVSSKSAARPGIRLVPRASARNFPWNL